MIYFLYGEDSYRSKQKLLQIIDQYKKVHKSGLNLISVDAKEADFKNFYSNFKISSMFAEKKLIVLKNVFGNAKFQEEFLENIKNIEELKDIVVIYEGEAPDQRLKFFKELKKQVKCQEFNFLTPAMLQKWATCEFEKNGAKINPDAMGLLLNFAGNNLWRLSGEIKKLADYRQGSVVKREDVELLVRPNIESDIFKTIDELAKKNKKEALFLLRKHLDNGDNSLYLLSMVAYQFRNLLAIKEQQDMGRPYGMIAKSCGLHPFVVQKSYYLCSQFSTERLKEIYQKIFETDSDIKTGKIDPELALDLLVSSI